MRNYNKTWMLILAVMTWFGCDNGPGVDPPEAYEMGVFIVNEGPFQNGTGSISFFDRTSGAVEHKIFQTANSGAVLGNIVQSYEVHQERGYAVVNNAGKVEVVDADNFSTAGTITGLDQPRYFLGINDSKGYVSQWGATGVDGSVQVVDLMTLTVTASISTGSGAGRMLMNGDKVYVVNGGGFGSDNTVSVINTATDEVEATITVGDNPNSLQLDANGKLWVLCGGRKVYDPMTFELDTAASTRGALYRINTQSNAEELNFAFDDVSASPSNLIVNQAGTTLYYGYAGSVYAQNVNENTPATTAFIGRDFYGMGIDPASGYIYGADAGDFTSPGQVIRYDGSTGAAIDTLEADVIPNGFYFR